MKADANTNQPTLGTNSNANCSRMWRTIRAMLAFDHAHLRYTFWKLWHRLDLSGVSADRLGFDASLRGHSNTGGPRLAAVLRSLRLPRNWPAVDIGGGKGGACFTLARFLEHVVGIELSPELIEIAKSNQRKLGLGLRHKNMFALEDARKFDYEKFQLFYIANPFGSEVAQAVVDRIEASLDRRDRPAVLIVYHPCQIEDWIHPKRFRIDSIVRFRDSHPFYIFKTQP